MSRLILLTVGLAAAMPAAMPAAAGVYRESIDAGAAPPALAEEAVVAGPLMGIEGSIAHAFDADLFRIRIDDPVAFSARATVVAGMAPSPQLFIFDGFGRGIVAALASESGLIAPPLIPSGTLAGWAAGVYLLGVSPAGNHPLAPIGASTERIFPDVATGLSTPAEVVRYTPLIDWTRDITAISGKYAIELTGAASALVLPGDYNNNGVVDAADYTVWRDTLGSTTVLAADGDESGTIGAGDHAVWQSNFGATSALDASGTTGASGAVPEPSCILLAVIAMTGLAIDRRRPAGSLGNTDR